MSYVSETIKRVKCDGCGRQSHEHFPDDWKSWVEITDDPLNPDVKHNCPECQQQAIAEADIGV